MHDEIVLFSTHIAFEGRSMRPAVWHITPAFSGYYGVLLLLGDCNIIYGIFYDKICWLTHLSFPYLVRLSI